MIHLAARNESLSFISPYTFSYAWFMPLLRVHWRSYKILTLDALLSRKKYMQQRHLLLFHKSLQCTLNVLKKGKVDILGSAIILLIILLKISRIGRHSTGNCFARSQNSMKKSQISPKIQIWPI